MFACHLLLTLMPLVLVALPAEGVSIEDVSSALALDTIIVDHLKTYLKEVLNEKGNEQLQENDIQLHHVTRYIDEYHQVLGTSGSSEAKREMEAVADPVKSLIVTRRLAIDWPRLLKISHDNNNTRPSSSSSSSSSWNKVKSGVLEAEKNLAVLMVEEDIVKQTSSMAQMINLYKLKPSFSHYQSSPLLVNLQIVDSAFLSDAALQSGMHGTAVELLTAVKEFSENVTSDTAGGLTIKKRALFLQQLQHLIHLTTALHDNKLITEGYKYQTGIYPLPLSQTSISTQKEAEEVLPPPSRFKNYGTMQRTTTEEEKINFALLCRGHSFLSEAEKSKLKCWMETRGGSPYLILMPALVEQNSLNPEVFTFHRVLTDSQMLTVTNMARPTLYQAEVQDGKIDKLSSFKYRSSYLTWLRQERHPLMKLINSKVAALTGLEVDERITASEYLQVNVYGAGGFYGPHLDTFDRDDQDIENEKEISTNAKNVSKSSSGNRMATLMFYMSDVEAGGYTVFPRIGMGVQPTKGSAVFWWNLLSDGTDDLRMLHGGCPVRKGVKWVSNKWIRYLPQFKNRPCLVTGGSASRTQRE